MSTRNTQTLGAYGSTDSPTLGDYGSGTTTVTESPSRESVIDEDPTEQYELDDDVWELKQRWGITKETFQFRLREHATASKPEERMCEVCNSRVTQTNTMGEVGHSPGHGMSEERCPHFLGGDD